MHVDLYERIWMWMAGALIVVFLGVDRGARPAIEAIQPPSHIETIDPDDARHATRILAARREDQTPTAASVVSVVAAMFSFTPDPIEVPAGRPMTFRRDQQRRHPRFQVVGTNANAMVVPGYVSQFTVTFEQAGRVSPSPATNTAASCTTPWSASSS